MPWSLSDAYTTEPFPGLLPATDSHASDMDRQCQWNAPSKLHVIGTARKMSVFPRRRYTGPHNMAVDTISHMEVWSQMGQSPSGWQDGFWWPTLTTLNLMSWQTRWPQSTTQLSGPWHWNLKPNHCCSQPQQWHWQLMAKGSWLNKRKWCDSTSMAQDYALSYNQQSRDGRATTSGQR